MRILTGSTGTNHITAADDGALYAGIIGSGSYVLDIGQKFAATVVNATTLKLADGDGVLQGRHFRTDPGETDTVTISEGMLDSNRNDIIGVKYTKDAGVESMAWQVIKGTATTGTAIDPTYDEGDVLGGESSAFMPLYRVKLSGANLTAVEPMFTVLTPARNHETDVNNPHGVTFRQVAGADVLPASKGGTGNTAGLAASATKLATARTIQTNLASTSSASFDGSANVAPGVSGVLPVGNGGTGAADGAGACKNIGALPTSGGDMTGGINFGSATRGLGWTTADGTQFALRPYAEGNLFQITRTPPGGTEVNAISVDTDGNILFGAFQQPLPVESGGTGNANGRATSAASADTAASADKATKLATARTIQTNLASTSSASFDGSANVAPGVTGVLPVGNGGTGAANAAGACANIGALPTSGGSMTGSIDFGGETRGLQWTTEDGTEWQVRPYAPGNVFQIVRHTTDGNYYGDVTIDSDGNTTLSQALPISSGGTGTNDTLQAAINFGLTAVDVADFSASSAGDWEGQVKAYILENVTTRRPFVFNAGWSGHDYGSGIAWNTSGAETFVIIQNMSGTGSVKFWRYCNESWSNILVSNESRGFYYSASQPDYVDGGIWLKPI